MGTLLKKTFTYDQCRCTFTLGSVTTTSRIQIINPANRAFTLTETEANTETDKKRLRARLHQVSASMLPQLCDDTSDTVLIENSEVTPEGDCNPFLSDSIIFNENSIASVIAE